jgi:hypothetical protein
MKFLRVIFVVIALAVMAEGIGDVFLRRIFASNNAYGGGNRNSANGRFETTRKPTKARGRSYKDICRAANPAPWAFPNKIPYPSVPIC